MPLKDERSDRVTPSTFRVPGRIPIFPLPSVVFFPHTYLPLHIFEPRYREMVADAVRHGQCIGMALLREGWEEGYYGNPPIHEIGCVGRLASVQELPEGRYNIVLQGLERYEIREQFHDRPYREATITVKPTATEPPLTPEGRAEIVNLLQSWLGEASGQPPWPQLLQAQLPDEMLVNGIAGLLDFTPLEKQFLLEADSLLRRGRRLLELLRLQVQDGNGTKGSG